MTISILLFGLFVSIGVNVALATENIEMGSFVDLSANINHGSLPLTVGTENLRMAKFDPSLDLSDDLIIVNEIKEKYAAPVFPETEILGNGDINKEALGLTIVEFAPAMVGIEDALIQNYTTYGIKPEYQLAVFFHESAYGESNIAQRKNNISSYRAYALRNSSGVTVKSVYENAKSYPTMSDCVLDFGLLMNDSYNLHSLDSVASKFCPPNKVNWAREVRLLMTSIKSHYDSLI